MTCKYTGATDLTIYFKYDGPVTVNVSFIITWYLNVGMGIHFDCTCTTKEVDYTVMVTPLIYGGTSESSSSLIDNLTTITFNVSNGEAIYNYTKTGLYYVKSISIQTTKNYVSPTSTKIGKTTYITDARKITITKSRN